MYRNNSITKSLRLAFAFSVVATSLPSSYVFAQENDVSIEKIEVTGSRIKKVDTEGANPVQIITREQLVASGITNMGDILQEIPAVAGAATNTAVNNGGNGAVRVSLRGLGSERTLVLLNGRRIVASGAGADASVDLSMIPTSIVKRVEVLKDGGSAIYGSDAIGGVVNIITRSDFDGFEFNASYDASTKNGDGETKSIDFTLGFTGDKGHAVFGAYYTKQGVQWSGDRDWSGYEYYLEGDGSFSKVGSSHPPWTQLNGINSSNADNLIQLSNDDGDLLFYDDAGEATITDTGEPILGLPDSVCDSFTHGAANGPGQSDPSSFSNVTGYDCWDSNKDFYNFAPANYHLTPQERYGIFASGVYEFSDTMRFSTEVNYNHRTSDIKLAPLPLSPLALFGITNASYSTENYYNQAFGPKDLDGNTVEIDDWRRRMVETGGRDSHFSIDTFRTMLALSGEIFDGRWAYELSYVYGSNNASVKHTGGVNFEKVALAVGPSFLDNETGEVLCGTVDAPIAGCTSLNIFGVPETDTQISQAMLDYITFEAHDLGGNKQQIISANLTGEAFELPAGLVGLAFGVENRKEEGFDYPDALIALGITSGSSRTSTEGQYEVTEAYAEADIPLLRDIVFFDKLSVDIALRYSDYNTFGDTTNYKVGVRWSPIRDLMVRATSSSAYRAPSIYELYSGDYDNSPWVSDPCSDNPTSFCISDGVPATGFVPLGDELSSTRGGNEHLTPEEADIITFGFVYSPEFLQGLSITLDYWDIDVNNAIATLGEQYILDSCAESGLYCDKITRFGSDTSLYGNSIDIDDRLLNVSGIESSGMDLNIRYVTNIALGQLTLNVDTTRYDSYKIEQADGTVIDNTELYLDVDYGGHGNFVKWKSNFDIDLMSDDWSIGWTTRYIGEVDELYWEIEGEYLRTVDSQIVHDVRFSYFFDNTTVSVGVDNLLDQDPPFLNTGFNDNTDPRTYNTTGRHAYVVLGLKF